METRIVNSKKNIMSGMLSSLIAPLCGFLIRTVIARYLGEEYLGLTSFLTSVLQVLNLAELGFSSAIIVNLYGPVSENNLETVRAVLAYYKKAYFIIGLVIAIVGTLITPFLPILIGNTDEIGENIYIVYFLYLLNTVISYFLFSYKEALLNALQRFDIVKKTYTVVLITKSFLQILSIIVLKNFYFFVLVLCATTIIYNLTLHIITVKKCPQYFPKGELNNSVRRNINKHIAGLSINKVLEVARNSLDSVILTMYLGLAVVGIYNNYYYIYNTLVGIMWMIITAIQASIGNSVATESVEKNHLDMIKFEFIYNIIISFITVYLLNLYQPFMQIWMGDKLLLNECDMMLFVTYFYAMAINGVRNAYYNALGLWWKGRWIAIVETVSNLILNIFLGKFWGVTGILLATVLTMVVINYICVTNLLFKEYFKTEPKLFLGNRIIYTIILVIICVGSYGVCGHFDFTGLAGIAVRVIICTVFLLLLFPMLLFVTKKELFIEVIKYLKQIKNA